MQQLDRLIDYIAVRRHWNLNTTMVFFIRHYPEIVGPNLSKHTTFRWFRKGTACIHCRNAMWSYALRSMEQDLIDKMNERIGTKVVKELLLRIGNVQEKEKKILPEIALTPEEIEWVETLVEKAPPKIKEPFKAFLISYKEKQRG